MISDEIQNALSVSKISWFICYGRQSMDMLRKLAFLRWIILSIGISRKSFSLALSTTHTLLENILCISIAVASKTTVGWRYFSSYQRKKNWAVDFVVNSFMVYLFFAFGYQKFFLQGYSVLKFFSSDCEFICWRQLILQQWGNVLNAIELIWLYRSEL